MPSLVVPFRGVKGKSRLGPLPRQARAALAVGDARRRCRRLHGRRADLRRRAAGARDVGRAALVPDPGGGQGAAVRAGLEAAALAAGGPSARSSS